MAGRQAVEVYNTFVFIDEEDKDNFDVVVKTFDEHCSPKTNESFERYVFRSRIQQTAESFDVFPTDLKLKARTCNFGVLHDSMIRDQLVFGLQNSKLRERLLQETELTLKSAVKICHASGLAMQHVRTFAGDATAVAMVLRKTNSKEVPRQSNQQNKSETVNCKKCGTQQAPTVEKYFQ